MKNISFSIKTVPIALFFLGLICFALLIPRIGLYWDDWPSLWFYHIFGSTIFPDVFASDRPVQGWLWVLTTGILGESIEAWQLFGIFSRWLSCLAVWWTLRLIWPQRSIEITWIAFLFMVYPGFSQQLIPMTYSHMFLVLAAVFFSFGTMIWAYRKPEWFWPLISISLLTSILSMFTLEYFVGLELLRPVFLWLTLEEGEANFRKRAATVLKRWLPYLLLMAAFLIWRNLQPTPRANILIFDRLRSDPVAAIIELGRTVLQDIFEGSVLAWVQVFNFSKLLVYRRSIILLCAIIVITSSVVTIFYLVKLRSPNELSQETISTSKTRWGIQAIFLGIYALFIAGWPFWVTDLLIDLRFPWDRFTLAMMFGASVLIAGIISLLTKKRITSAIITGVLVGLAVGVHFETGLAYMREWNYQKAFFWQMVWRAPHIQPGTTILTSRLPFKMTTDNSLIAPLNWIYAPDNSSNQMPYLMLNLDGRLNKELSNLEEGEQIQYPYRATHFEGTSSQAILLFYSPEHCLKVINPELDQYWPYQPGFIPDAFGLSNPGLIIGDPETSAQPPASVFGTEPSPDWCYYFEKAELARQFGDWEQAAEYADKALRLDKSFNRKNIAELLTFIEAYAHNGQWDKAVQLSIEANRYPEIMQDSICQSWYRIQINNPVSVKKESALDRIKTKLDCDFP